MDNRSFLQLVQKESSRDADNMMLIQQPPPRQAAAQLPQTNPPRSPCPGSPRQHAAQGNISSSNNSAANSRTEFRGYNYALIICQHPVTKKLLAVHETKNRGWWIPGGGVMAGETLREAAIREAWEEAGVKIELKGVLRIEHALLSSSRTGGGGDGSASFFKMRVIFYAEPADVHNCEPKSIPNDESLGAEWLTTREFQQKQNIRGNDLLKFAALVEQGKIYLLDVLDEG